MAVLAVEFMIAQVKTVVPDELAAIDIDLDILWNEKETLSQPVDREK